MNRCVIAWVTSLAVLLAGCGVSTAPTRVSEFGGRNAASMMVAPWNGWYKLNRLPESKGGASTAVRIVYLKKNEPLGFRTEEHGVVAVAGPLDEPVGAGKYEWVMVADPGQINPVATTILVVTIVVIVGVATALIVIVATEDFAFTITPTAYYGLNRHHRR